MHRLWSTGLAAVCALALLTLAADAAPAEDAEGAADASDAARAPRAPAGAWAAPAAIGVPEAACTPSDTAMCLDHGGYQVSATFSSGGGSGMAHALAITADTGYLWFFSSSNVEVVLKVIDGCAVNGKVWVFAGGLTNVQVDITVVQGFPSITRHYVNPPNTPFQPIQDTAAFPCSIISSARFKQDVADMGDASAGLMKLRPVTFHYRPEITLVDERDKSLPQYGLIAEEVAKIYPSLVQLDQEGKPFAVRYHLLNAMLLNELQKQRAEEERQRGEIEQLRRQIQAVRERLEALGQKGSPKPESPKPGSPKPGSPKPEGRR